MEHKKWDKRFVFVIANVGFIDVCNITAFSFIPLLSIASLNIYKIAEKERFKVIYIGDIHKW